MSGRAQVTLWRTGGVRTDGGPVDGFLAPDGSAQYARDGAQINSAPAGSIFESAPGAYPLTKSRLRDDRASRSDVTFVVKKPVGAKLALLVAHTDQDSLANSEGYPVAIGPIPCDSTKVDDLLPSFPSLVNVLYYSVAADSKTFTLQGSDTVNGEWAGIAGAARTRARIVIEGNKAATDRTERYARIASVDTANNRFTIDSAYVGSDLTATLRAWIWPGYEYLGSVVGYRDRTEGLRPQIIGFNKRAIALVPNDRPLVVKDGYAYPMGLRKAQKTLLGTAGTTAYLDAGDYRVFAYLADARNNRIGSVQSATPTDSFPIAVAASGMITVGAGAAATAGSFPSLAAPFKKTFTVNIGLDDSGSLTAFKKVTITAGDSITDKDLRREVRIAAKAKTGTYVDTNARIVRIETTGASGVFYVDTALTTEAKTGEALHLWTEEYTHWGVGIQKSDWPDIRFAVAIAKETAEDLDDDLNYAGYAIGGTSSQTNTYYLNQPTVPSRPYPLFGFMAGTVVGSRMLLGRRPKDTLSNVTVENAGSAYPCNGYPRMVKTVSGATQLFDPSHEGRTILIGGKPYLIDFVVSTTELYLAEDFTETLSTGSPLSPSYAAEIQEENNRVFFSHADDDLCEMADPLAYVEVLKETNDGIKAIDVADSQTAVVFGGEHAQQLWLNDWADIRGSDLLALPVRRDEDILPTGCTGNQAHARTPDGYVYLFRGVRGVDRVRGRLVENISFDMIQSFIATLDDTKFSEACAGYWPEKNWILFSGLYRRGQSDPDCTIIWDIIRQQWAIWQPADGTSAGERRITALATLPMRRLPATTADATNINVPLLGGFGDLPLLDIDPTAPTDNLEFVASASQSTILAAIDNLAIMGRDGNNSIWLTWTKTGAESSEDGLFYHDSGDASPTQAATKGVVGVPSNHCYFPKYDGEGCYYAKYTRASGNLTIGFANKSAAATVATLDMSTAGLILFPNAGYAMEQQLDWAQDGSLFFRFYKNGTVLQRAIRIDPVSWTLGTEGAVYSGNTRSGGGAQVSPSGRIYEIFANSGNTTIALYSYKISSSGPTEFQSRYALTSGDAAYAHGLAIDTNGVIAMVTCKSGGTLTILDRNHTLLYSGALTNFTPYGMSAGPSAGAFMIVGMDDATSTAQVRFYSSTGALLDSVLSTLITGQSNYFMFGYNGSNISRWRDYFGQHAAILRGLLT